MGGQIDRGGASRYAHPVSCAAALANVAILEKEDLVGNPARVGAYLLERLRALQARRPIVGEVRGRGLMRVADLTRAPADRWPATWWTAPTAWPTTAASSSSREAV